MTLRLKTADGDVWHVRLGSLVAVSRHTTRRVAILVGETLTGRPRIRAWRHSSATWSKPYSIPAAYVSPAPKDWIETRAAQRRIADVWPMSDRGLPRV